MKRRLFPSGQACARLFGLLVTTGSMSFGFAQGLSGTFAVGLGGSASYSIPLHVFPAAVGMAPKLVLSYDSQVGDGLLGVGWSLSGLSVISRCAQSPLQDVGGKRLPITFKATDRFCFDGQRLMLTSGTHGADGSEYRTEMGGYDAIKASAVSGVTTTAGPARFTVKTPAGLTMEFGGTADSRIFAGAPNATAVMTWALNKVTDALGNTMTVSYTVSTGEHRPSAISYSGGTVEFTYEARPDPSLSFLELSPVKQTYRLAGIHVKRASVGTRTYGFSYVTAPSTKRSLLSKVTMCSPAPSCVPAATFAYSDATTTASRSVTVGGNGVGNGGWDVGDLFGDGADVYWTYNRAGEHHATRVYIDGTVTNWYWSGGHSIGGGGWRLVNAFGGGRKVFWTREGSTHYITQLNKDGTLQNRTYVNGHNIGNGGWDFVDLFGDGREVYWTRNGSTHYATRLNPDGTVQNWTWAGHNVGSAGHRFVNLFGDGRKVYWSRTGSTHYISRLNEDGTVDNWTVGAHGEGSNGFDFADLFGEGRDVYWTRSGVTHYASRFNPDGTVTNWTWGDGHGHGNGGTRFVDLFGDGRKVYWTRNNDVHYATRLNADGTLNNFTWSGHGSGDAGSDFVDLFGNGRDVYWTFSKSGMHYSTRLYPDGTVKNDSWYGHATAADGYRMVDFAGTGKRTYWAHSGSTHYLTTSIEGESDLLTSAKTETTAGINISYLRLPQMEKLGASRFSRNAVVAYPLQNLSFSFPVVESTSTSDGIGGTANTQYSYGNLIVDTAAQGRGSLGFQWTQTKDLQTGLVSRTYYRQDFPYVGMVDKVGKGTSEVNWSNLSLAMSEYKFLSFAETGEAGYANPTTCVDDPATGKTSSACPASAIQPGNRYVPYVWRSLAKSWDWKGSTEQASEFTAMPQTRTTMTMDKWLNATEVLVETLDASGNVTGYAKKTLSDYAPADTTNWKFGRLLKTRVETSAP